MALKIFAYEKHENFDRLLLVDIRTKDVHGWDDFRTEKTARIINGEWDAQEIIDNNTLLCNGERAFHMCDVPKQNRNLDYNTILDRARKRLRKITN